MKSEIHLFLIWKNAYPMLDEIAEDISKEFKIMKQIEVVWSKEKFSNNLTQFYGTKLPPNSFKEKHCGNGPFTVLIVKDVSPKYEDRETSKGIKNVNIRMFDLKSKYRAWTGGGHKIHASNSIKETEHDLMLLFGKYIREVENNNWGQLQNKEKIIRNIEGATGWRNLTHLFVVLNMTVEYVILRNYEDFEKDDYKDDDIDILTNNPEELLFISRAEKIYFNKRRVAYWIRINSQKVYFDIRRIGDNYYNSNWQETFLMNRSLAKEGYFILNNEDYFYSLLYHGLIHKHRMSEVYESRLLKLSRILKIDLPKFNSNEEIWIKILITYMKKNRYLITVPKDYSVFFNKLKVFDYKKDILTQTFRIFRTILVKLKNKIK